MIMNFYTADYLTKYPSNTKDKVDQSFLKERILAKFPHSNFIISNPYDIAEEITRLLGTKNYLNGFHSDISGIIVPLCNEDINMISNISMNIDGSFGVVAKREFKSFDSHLPFFLSKEEFERARSIRMEELFYDSFQIPVFEAYKYLPGYRYENKPHEKEINDPHKTIILVQAMYGLWLNTIKKKN